MSDPIRLRDDPSASPILRALVAAAPRTPEMPEDTVDRTRVRAGRRLLPAAASVGAWLGWKSLAAAAVVATGVVWFDARDAITPAPRTIERPRPRVPFVVAARPAPVPSPPPSSIARVEGPKPRLSAPTREAARAPAAPPPNVEPRATSLDEELRLLGEGSGALGHAPAKALELANLHAERHARGQLVVERELLAVDALTRLGRNDEARTRARRALPLARGSFLEARLRERAAIEP